MTAHKIKTFIDPPPSCSRQGPSLPVLSPSKPRTFRRYCHAHVCPRRFPSVARSITFNFGHQLPEISRTDTQNRLPTFTVQLIIHFSNALFSPLTPFQVLNIRYFASRFSFQFNNDTTAQPNCQGCPGVVVQVIACPGFTGESSRSGPLHVSNHHSHFSFPSLKIGSSGSSAYTTSRALNLTLAIFPCEGNLHTS